MAIASGATGGDQTGNRRTGLVVNNSLRKEKVPFVTKDGSPERDFVYWRADCIRLVLCWTRAELQYVTFDIIRQILEGYFHYNVKYVMNVTDVDDKIINRARRNYLMDRYRSTSTDPDQACVMRKTMKLASAVLQIKPVQLETLQLPWLLM